MAGFLITILIFKIDIGIFRLSSLFISFGVLPFKGFDHFT